MPCKTLLFVILIFCFIYTAELFENVPPSRRIEADEQGEYTFGVEDEWTDPRLEICYYTNDIGQDGSFVISTPVLRKRDVAVANYTIGERKLENVITTLGGKSLCQINVRMVNATGPTKWTLTLGETKDHNITSIDFFVKFFHGARILESEIKLLSSKSFYNHLLPVPGNKFVSCNLKMEDLNLDLPLDKIESQQQGGLSSHITSLGRGLCGLKYDNALFNDISYKKWNLSAQAEDGKFYKQTFRTSVPQTFGIFRTKKSIVLGSPALISCGERFGQTFCTLFNPQGEIIVTDNCVYSINSFGVHHLGEWKCYSGMTYSLDSLEYVVEYVRVENPKLVPILKETKTEITIGCKVDRFTTGDYTFCKLTAPNRKTFNVRQGSATERYTTIGTKFNSGICVFHIKKPLLPFENGYWRCELEGPYKSDYGGVFLKVGKAERPPYKTRYRLKVELFKPFGVYCEVSYRSDFCYIKSPNGTIYKNQFHSQVNIGKCSFSVTEALPSDNGSWTCFFARETGEPSEEIVVEVTITDMLHSYDSVEVDVGSTAQLLCISDGLPLSYCEFIAPNGKAYFIKKQDSSSNIRYYGKGLEYGDCGISIAKTSMQDIGDWTCVVRFVRDQKQEKMQAKISLNVQQGLNTAALGIGLGAGVLAIGVVIGGFLVIRKLRNRPPRVSVRNTGIQEVEMRPRAQPDNLSESSNEVGP